MFYSELAYSFALVSVSVNMVHVFPQASLCSHPSFTRWILGAIFPNAFFAQSIVKTVKAFGYAIWIGVGIADVIN